MAAAYFELGTFKSKRRKKPFIPEPYNRKTYGDMNLMFWENHQNTPLEEAKEMLKQSHKKVLDLAETFTNEELFSKDVYKWAIKKLKANQKNCKNK